MFADFVLDYFAEGTKYLITLVTGEGGGRLVSPEDMLLEAIGVTVGLAALRADVQSRGRRAVLVQPVSAGQMNLEIVLCPFNRFTAHWTE